MKDKIINYNSCISIFQPNSQLSFGSTSPIPLISGPTTTLFYYCAGSMSYTSIQSITFGTIGRLRIDTNDEQPLNQDQWTVNSTGTASLVRLAEVKKENIPNHHSVGLPVSINSVAPDWIKELIKEKLEHV